MPITRRAFLKLFGVGGAATAIALPTLPRITSAVATSSVLSSAMPRKKFYHGYDANELNRPFIAHVQDIARSGTYLIGGGTFVTVIVKLRLDRLQNLQSLVGMRCDFVIALPKNQSITMTGVITNISCTLATAAYLQGVVELYVPTLALHPEFDYARPPGFRFTEQEVAEVVIRQEPLDVFRFRYG